MLLLILGLGQISAPAAQPDELGEAVEFNHHILPILSDKCFQCHGPDENARQADLRLDVELDALTDRGDRAAIVPHHPQRSELVAKITHHDPSKRMPPRDSELALSPREIDLLIRWIDQGAK